jgi:membrane protease subunit HflK
MNDEFKNSPDSEKKKARRKIRPGHLKDLNLSTKFSKLFSGQKLFTAIWSQKDGSAFNDIKKAFGHLNPKKTAISLILGLLVVYMLTGIYIVNPGEQAVIRRFGAVQPQAVSEGIHYRLPYPVDQVQKVSVSEVRRADIGMSLPEHLHNEDDAPQSIQLLTGDENIIASQAIVHYKVKDAAKFLYSVSENSEQLVRYGVEAALVKAMAVMPVDNILSTEKVQVQNSIMQNTQEILDSYDAGIQITAFNIQAITPPDAVADAFLDVTTAKEEKETAINEANGYYNSLIPEARAKANTAISQAESYKTQQVNLATGEADKFVSMLQQYQNNSRIYSQDTTKYRLLLETFEKILPKVNKYIVDSSDGSVDVKMFDPSMLTDTQINGPTN